MKTCAPRRPCCWVSSRCWKASWRKPEVDEGFDTLDPETLEAVTLTLESLHEKGRLVAVITHVQELAERLPMQVRVEKGQGASRIRKVIDRTNWVNFRPRKASRIGA